MRLIYLPLLLISLFTFMHCGQSADNRATDDNDVSETDTTSSATYYEPEGALIQTSMLEISPAAFKPDSIQRALLSILNTTDESITFGSEFTIERHSNGEWEETDILDEILFTQIAYILEPDQSQEMTVILRPEDYTYEPGQYRLCKSFLIAGSRQTDCVEFRVN
jgi:hypothetical protein